MHIIEELQARNQVADVTHEKELKELLAGGDAVPFYAGFDPTATSLHLGNLIPILLLRRIQLAGHRPIAVVGGATGMIGDPSGKSDERNLLDEKTLTQNCEAIRGQLSRFLDFGKGPSGAEMVSNLDWFKGIGYIEFLRDIGKLLSVNYMAAKDSVKSRLDNREQGISYTEFSYMLLQAYDFVHLAEHHGCRLQVGGSDQWGNITAGCELQRKMGRPAVYGLTAPLLLDSKGEKMGKTASGARIWLDPDLTSPYAMYQYWLNLDDADVEKALLTFSFRSLEEIGTIVANHAEAPQKRAGQKALAQEVTTWIHSEAAMVSAEKATQVMFGGSLADLKDKDLTPLLQDIPSSELDAQSLKAGMPLVDILAQCKLAKSKGEARRLVKGGGVYINNEREADVDRTLTNSDLGTETMLVLRAGKKNYHIPR